MFDRLVMLRDRNVRFCLSFDSTNGIPVPEECYDNKVNVATKNSGYRRTLLKMDSKDTYENLYINQLS